MYELCQAAERSYYIDCPAKIGLYRAAENEIYLIDSGSDKDTAKKVKRVLDENGWQLRGILNTHSHADHIGGNHYLQQQTGCKVFSTGVEADFIRHPILEPAFLYGGYPCKELRHKFLLAQESEVSDFADDAFPKEIEIIPLAGHSFGMAGFRTPDDVVYLADCLSSRETLDKYGIGFIYDVGAYLETLEAVQHMAAKLFIPSHAAPAEDIRPLAQYNEQQVRQIAERIVDLCREPICFEDLLARLFQAYQLRINFQQYALVGSTVRSYLAWLKETGRVTVEFEEAEKTVMWRAQ